MGNERELRQFLERTLPKENRDQVDDIIGELDRASRRYERYAGTRSQWWSHEARRKSLRNLSDASSGLRKSLAHLDLITKDDLATVLGDEEVEKIQGYLASLEAKSSQLCETVQRVGRPRDLAAERWIHEVADIYKANFKRKATISGSGAARHAKRGPFYELLKFSQPPSYPRHGALHPRQLKRILERRERLEWRERPKQHRTSLISA